MKLDIFYETLLCISIRLNLKRVRAPVITPQQNLFLESGNVFYELHFNLHGYFFHLPHILLNPLSMVTFATNITYTCSLHYNISELLTFISYNYTYPTLFSTLHSLYLYLKVPFGRVYLVGNNKSFLFCILVKLYH